MPITEYYSQKVEEDIECGISFRIRDEIWFFDQRLAYTVNHLYDHIRFLVNLVSQDHVSLFTEMDFLKANYEACLGYLVYPLRSWCCEILLFFYRIELMTE